MENRPIHIGGEPPSHFKRYGLGKSLQNHFDFEISQDELHEQVLARAGGIPADTTVADLHAVIWKHLQASDAFVSRPSRREGFRQVRKILLQIEPKPSPRARPSTRLADLLPFRTRPQAWAQLQKALDPDAHQIPPLQFPRLVEKAANICIASLSVGSILFLISLNTRPLRGLAGRVLPYWWNGGLSTAALLLFLTVGLPILIGLGSRLGAPLRRSLPPGYATLRGLVESMWPRRMQQWRAPLGWTEAQVWQALREILKHEDMGTGTDIKRMSKLILDPPYRIACDFCGYDLRSSDGRCPECGIATRAQRIPRALHQMLRPSLTVATALRFAGWQLRKVALGPGIAAAVGVAIIIAGWCAPMGWALALLGFWMALRRLFNRHLFRDASAAWQQLPCPRCGELLTRYMKHRTSAMRYTLSCTGCGVRHDVRAPIRPARKKGSRR